MRWLTRAKGHWLRGIGVGLGAGLISVVGLLDGFERAALDTAFHLRGPIPPKTPIVIVSIDEDSFDELQLQWPWPRALHARFLDLVSRGRPAAIGLDLIFSEPSSRGPEDDRELGMAIGRAGNVVLGAALTEVKTPLFVKEGLNAPIPVIREGAAAFGFVNFVREGDAFVRWASLARAYQGDTLSSFDLHVYHVAIRAGIRAAPLPQAPRFLINFRGGPGTFPTVSFARVLNGEVGPETFTGKIVLVGATSPILHDAYPTPFAPQGQMPGVEVHANVLETLFQGIPVRRAHRGLSIALTLIAGLLAVGVARHRRPLAALAAVVAAAGGYVAAGLVAFVWGRLWLEVVGVSAALVLGYGATLVENFIREQREKRRLSRYFSPSVVREILQQREGVNLSSARRPVTVLFSDIRGFTSLSERLPPEEVVALLREYLTVMSDAVFSHGGTVDKYIGDAIMALYNVPFDQPDHAAQAVRTALAFQRRLQDVGARFRAREGVELRCGVGIHTGEAVVGTIGAEQRLEYTAIGDTINLGSRLESLTKDFRVPIIISESTREAVRGKFLTRYFGEVTVRGRHAPVKIYGVEEADARREARVRVEPDITTVIVVEGELRIHAPVTDMSRGGLSARDLPKEFATGQVVQLLFDVPAGVGGRADGGSRAVPAGEGARPVTPSGGPRAIAVHGRVAWMAADRAGFRFLDLNPDDQTAIEAYLARRPGPPGSV